MIRLLWPWVFLLAPLPLLIRALLPPAVGGPALRVPSLDRFRGLPGGGAGPREWPWLALALWLCLLLAAARPQWVAKPEGTPVTGRDLVLAVDISGSMRTRDFFRDGDRVSRLQAVKRVAGTFLERRQGDRLALVLFGPRPFLLAPLTYDRGGVRELLEGAEVALAGERTAVGDAIGLGVRHLRQRPARSRALVLLTDGASNTGRLTPRQAARVAADYRVRIYTIGVGGPGGGGPAPNREGPWGARTGGAHAATLEAVAEATGGRHFRARDTAGLERAYRALDRLEPTLGREVPAYYARPLYPWLLGPVLAGALWLGWRRTAAGAPGA